MPQGGGHGGKPQPAQLGCAHEGITAQGVGCGPCDTEVIKGVADTCMRCACPPGMGRAGVGRQPPPSVIEGPEKGLGDGVAGAGVAPEPSCRSSSPPHAAMKSG